ncbi:MULTISPECIES: PAS domain-containing protein [unclassified Rhizobium]|uniref:PAS domain-containing protein n=1 Tax=unclassified Rhizobium TaxID=2613769 RepID=UPI0028A019A0
MLLEDLYRLMKTGHVLAQGVVDTMTQPVVVLDEHLCVIAANNAFIKAFQVERDDVLSKDFFLLATVNGIFRSCGSSYRSSSLGRPRSSVSRSAMTFQTLDSARSS